MSKRPRNDKHSKGSCATAESGCATHAVSDPSLGSSKAPISRHVGLKNLLLHFSTVHRLLKPARLFLNHGTTPDVEGWRKTSSTDFINRCVFPDGQLDSVSNIRRGLDALTLRHWVARLEQRHEQALECERIDVSNLAPVHCSLHTRIRAGRDRHLPGSGHQARHGRRFPVPDAAARACQIR